MAMDDFLNILDDINALVYLVLEQQFEMNKTELIIQQQKQIFAGQKSDGSIIRPAYSPATVRLKIRKGQPDDRVTLKDKGDFYKSIKPMVPEDVLIALMIHKYGV